MKSPSRFPACLALVLGLWITQVQAQITWVTNNGTITITRGPCPIIPGGVVVPETLSGLLVTALGDGAFAGCGTLTRLSIPSTVTSIGSGVFTAAGSRLTVIEVNPANPSYESVDGVLFDKGRTELIAFPGGRGGEYTIPDGVTRIAAFAFSASTLTRITLPISVTRIGNCAFCGCANLTNIVIPDRVTHIGEGAFSGTGLASVTIPDGVTAIAGRTFADCRQLTNVTIGSGVNSIGDEAFLGTGLGSVTISDRVIGIGSSAFKGCTSLARVSLGSGLSNLGGEAFGQCAALAEVYFAGNAPNVGVDPFLGVNNAILYHLPGTSGWGPTLAGLPTAVWALPRPVILTSASSVEAKVDGFGFRISWATNGPVVVESATSLSAPDWSPVSTNTLVDGWSEFRDPEGTAHGHRLYRVRRP